MTTQQLKATALKSHKCPIKDCGQNLLTQEALAQHLETHETPNKQQEDQVNTETKEAIKATVTFPARDCFWCGRTIPSEEVRGSQQRYHKACKEEKDLADANEAAAVKAAKATGGGTPGTPAEAEAPLDTRSDEERSPEAQAEAEATPQEMSPEEALAHSEAEAERLMAEQRAAGSSDATGSGGAQRQTRAPRKQRATTTTSRQQGTDAGRRMTEQAQELLDTIDDFTPSEILSMDNSEKALAFTLQTLLRQTL